MSGGSWDYVYRHFDEIADRLESASTSAIRRALGKRVRFLAKAMHDIEWVDSSDYAQGDDRDAIIDALGEKSKEQELTILLEDAKEMIKQLQDFTGRAT